MRVDQEPFGGRDRGERYPPPGLSVVQLLCFHSSFDIFQAFNEELDGMFNDVNLPESEAWGAMTKDIRETKAARNNLKRENAQVPRPFQCYCRSPIVIVR